MKKHILLIDDDKDELILFLDALKEVPGSFKCTYAASLDHAASMLEYLQPDFIFIDYNMPPGNGLELLSRIKKDKKLNDIPVFLYSTTITDNTNLEAKNLGASGCIEKPGSIGMMSSVLRSVLMPFEKRNYFLSKGN